MLSGHGGLTRDMASDSRRTQDRDGEVHGNFGMRARVEMVCTSKVQELVKQKKYATKTLTDFSSQGRPQLPREGRNEQRIKEQFGEGVIKETCKITTAWKIFCYGQSAVKHRCSCTFLSVRDGVNKK